MLNINWRIYHAFNFTIITVGWEISKISHLSSFLIMLLCPARLNLQKLNTDASIN